MLFEAEKEIFGLKKLNLENQNLMNSKSFKTKRLTTVTIYALMLVGGALISSPFTAIAKSMQKLSPSLSLKKINLSSSIFTLAGIVAGFFTTYLISKLGRKTLTFVCGLLYCASCFMRFIWLDWTTNKYDPSEKVGNFDWILLAQALGGMGGAICQNGIGGFADSWFSIKNVTCVHP